MNDIILNIEYKKKDHFNYQKSLDKFDNLVFKTSYDFESYCKRHEINSLGEIFDEKIKNIIYEIFDIKISIDTFWFEIKMDLSSFSINIYLDCGEKINSLIRQLKIEKFLKENE